MKEPHDGVKLAIQLLWWLGIFCIAGILSSAKVVGFIVKWAIEGLDTTFLGVNIWVGKAALSLCRGYIFVSNVVVDNPAEQEFTSPALLKIGKMVLKLNLWRLIKSRATEIEINMLVLTGIEVNYEKDFLTNSNVGLVIDFLQPKTATVTEVAAKVDEKNATAAATKLAGAKDASASAAKPDSPPQIELHMLQVKDISVNVWTTQTGKLLSVNLGDMEDKDFQARYAGQQHVLVGDIVAGVLKTFLNTVSANSHRLTHNVAAIAQDTTMRKVRAVTGGLKGLFSCLPCGAAADRRRKSNDDDVTSTAAAAGSSDDM